MAVTTNAFENYKNSIAPSEKGGFLSKLKGFGTDALGGLDSFMGKDIINANKLLKSFTGFNLGNIFGNLGDFFGDLWNSALGMLKDMGMDALRALENASINFVSNLAEDLYNNVRAMMYIPDKAFAVTLMGMYYAGADLAYENHYIRNAALLRDWQTSLEFIDEQYGIEYGLRDYGDLEKDLLICANNSCVNNLYYIFDKLYDQIKELRVDNSIKQSDLNPYSKPIEEYKELTALEAMTHDVVYAEINGEMVKLDMEPDTVGKPSSGVSFIKDHPVFKYYTTVVSKYEGIDSNGIYSYGDNPTNDVKTKIDALYETYKNNVDLLNKAEDLMVKYFKILIVHSYTYLTASSVQKFFSDFKDVLKPCYYGVTDPKYNQKYKISLQDCYVMMPDYKGNDVTKSDMYTQELAKTKNAEYLAKAANESDSSKNRKGNTRYTHSTKTSSKTEKAWNAWDTNDGTTIEGAVQNGLKNASNSIHKFRETARTNVAASQNASYSSAIQNGMNGALSDKQKQMLMRTSGEMGINAKKDNIKISSVNDREIVKFYELLGQIGMSDTSYVVLRNKNIKEIYTLMANSTIYGSERLVNDDFYKRCKIKTMNTLNQSLSKVSGILGSTYMVQAAFDMESALDSSAYVYLKKVEKFLLNPKEHSYYGLDTMFSGDDNMWTQFGDYFKQAYTWDDSISDDNDLEEMVSKLTNTTPSSTATVGTSDIDPSTDLGADTGANGETYKEAMAELDANEKALAFVDNVVRMMSSISSLDLRDILVSHLTMFYNFMKSRGYNPNPYFKNLIKSMSAIDGIDNPGSLNTSVFNKSTRKSIMANVKFLISIYALKNSYKYFLTDENDSNKEEITKIYDLAFALGSANIQMTGTISAISKYDREQLNSLAKQNFFNSISHLKSLNDKNNPLITTAPGYKDALTKTFGNSFDLRGLTGYSLENNKILYVTEQSTGDWNSVVCSPDSEIGTFFCKSNVNSSGRGVYRRPVKATTLTSMKVKLANGTELTDRDLYGISFSDVGAIYFGLDDISESKPASSGTLFVYDSTNDVITEVRGFTGNPKEYNFIADSDLNLLIISSKSNGGFYYSTLGTNVCSQGASTGANHKIVKLSNGAKIVYPTKGISPLVYFDKTGKYVNTVDIPGNVTDISSVQSVISNVNITYTLDASPSTGGEGEAAPAPLPPVTMKRVISGLLIGTNVGMIHYYAYGSADVNSITGVSKIGPEQLYKGKTYNFSSDNNACYIYGDNVLGVSGKDLITRNYTSKSYTTTLSASGSGGSTSSLLDSVTLFEFGSPVQIANPTYKPSDGSNNHDPMIFKKIIYTTNGIYVLVKRDISSVSTNELYFVPGKFNTTTTMNLIRENIDDTKTDVKEIVNPDTTSSSIPNIVIFSDKSLSFVYLEITGQTVTIKSNVLKFDDIVSESPSKDSTIIKSSNSEWVDISIPGENKLFIENKKYGLIMFNGTVNEIMKYSNLVGGDVTEADLIFDYKILRAGSKLFFINKSSGNKYIKNCYGIFVSSNDGLSRSYADSAAFHDGDFGDIAYNKHEKIVYFCTYRDKTIFDYDFLATTAAFDIDSYLNRLSYYEISKLTKSLMITQTQSIGDSLEDLLAKMNEDGTDFAYTLDELLGKITESSLKTQQDSNHLLVQSSLFADLANYKAANDMFGEDIDNPRYASDMTAEFIMNYPGTISTAPNVVTNYAMVGDINGDGVVDELDENWYEVLANGGSLEGFVSLDKWFENLTNGIYGNGLSGLSRLRLSYNEQLKLLVNFRSSKVKYIVSGKAISKDDVVPGISGPNSIIDPSTDKDSKDFKWYNGMSFTSDDFINSDEDGVVY